MSDENNRSEEEKCHFCNANAFIDCTPDCPTNFAKFGTVLPDSLRHLITSELIKQAEYIYERKQQEWYNQMLLERVQDVMKDWSIFMSFVKVLDQVHYFRSTTEIIKFLEQPSIENNTFMLWCEMGSPTTPNSKHWELFLQALQNKGVEDGRTGK